MKMKLNIGPFRCDYCFKELWIVKDGVALEEVVLKKNHEWPLPYGETKCVECAEDQAIVIPFPSS